MSPSQDSDPGEPVPPGRQPYDVFNGARIGALAGGLLGVLAVAVIGAGGLVAVILLAMAGSVIGYAWERNDAGDGDR
ncbi:MAG TPA: hypothetical protein VLG28_18335 [Acidimicrobiia bacterium]|jgi:hypothetical protein|nr:hypothetical protein [Acidimicrobiia bacterium]